MPQSTRWLFKLGHLGGTWRLKTRAGHFHWDIWGTLSASKRALITSLGYTWRLKTPAGHFHWDTWGAPGASKRALVTSIGALGGHLGPQCARWSCPLGQLGGP